MEGSCEWQQRQRDSWAGFKSPRRDSGIRGADFAAESAPIHALSCSQAEALRQIQESYERLLGA